MEGRRATDTCVCMSFICYLAACGLKGHGSGLPLPSRTAELSKHDQIPVPNHSGSNWGNPFPYYPSRQTKERLKDDKGKTKEKYILGRARLALLALRTPGALLASVFTHSCPGHLGRRSAPHPRVLQELHYCPHRVVLP